MNFRKWLAGIIETRGGGVVAIWLTPAMLAGWALLATFSPKAAALVTPEIATQFISSLLVSVIVWVLRKEKIETRKANVKIQEAVNDSTIPVVLPVTGEVRPEGETVKAVERLSKLSKTIPPVAK